MVMSIPLKNSISSVVDKPKSHLTLRLYRAFTWLVKVFWNRNIIWSLSKFVSRGGVAEETLKIYVELQRHQNSGQLCMKLQ